MARYNILLVVRSQWVAHRKHIIVLAGFLLFFVLLLLPIPLSGSLMGSIDSLLAATIDNALLNHIRAGMLGQSVGSVMYPTGMLRYGEFAVGITGTFGLLSRVLGIPDVTSLYLTQVGMLSLMAIGMVLFAEEYTGSLPAAILAAFIFTTSNFVWADIDRLALHFYFLPLICGYYMKKALQVRSPAALAAAGIAGGLQFYFSIQVYIYQSMIIGILIVFSLRSLLSLYSSREKWIFALLYTCIPFPLFLFYLNTLATGVAMSPFAGTWEQLQPIYAVQLSDLLRVLPDKLIHYPFTTISTGGYGNVAHSAFIGVVAPVLGIAGMVAGGRKKWELLTIGAVGLLFALGITIEVANTHIPSPLVVFYEYVPLAKFLRWELRSYSVSLLALSILAGLGWKWIAARLYGWGASLPAVVLILAVILIAAENISWPLNRYEIIKYPAIPEGYLQFFKDKPTALILDLPSHSTSWPGLIDEMIYMLWQAQHGRNILGGVSGYYPASRLEAQHYTDLLPSPAAFEYFQRIGVTHIVWHDSPFLVCHIPHSLKGCDPATGIRLGMDREGFSWLSNSPYLKLIYADAELKIYELQPGSHPMGRVITSPTWKPQERLSVEPGPRSLTRAATALVGTSLHIGK